MALSSSLKRLVAVVIGFLIGFAIVVVPARGGEPAAYEVHQP